MTLNLKTGNEMTIFCIGRVSTKNQAQEGRLGMASQFVEMHNYIQANYPNEDTQSFMDNGISGSAPLSKREGLMSALTAMKRGDVLLAYDVSRLCRSAMLMVVIEQEVSRKGGRIETVVGNNEDSPEGKLLRHLLIGIADYQRTSQNAKIKMALKLKAKTHNLGKAPFGMMHNDDQTEFILLDEEQRVIRIARDFAKADGKKWGLFTRLALHLNENGFTIRSGGKWTPTNVNQILKRHIA